MTLPLDPKTKRSPDSGAMLPYWDKVDAIIDGVEAMRREAKTFLPKFSTEADIDYAFRLKCTTMTNVYRDIVEGLSSKPFEQSVVLVEDQGEQKVAVPQSMKQFSYDVDGAGNNLTVFAAETFFNGINSAIDWIMIDHDKAPGNGPLSVAERNKLGLRAYWSHVLGRNVLEVRSRVVRNREILTYIRILEPGSPDCVREFWNTDGKVTWELSERREQVPVNSDTMFVRIDGGTLSIDEIPLVPFITGRRDGRTWKIFPALQDAADLQVELYQKESNLKYAEILTAFPMLAANGMEPPIDPTTNKPMLDVPTGPNRVLWAKSDGNGRVGSWSYVEPGAMSLEFLAKRIDTTIANLRELGRQPLTASSSNITVITAAVAAGKAKSAVRAWAYKLKDTLEQALRITCKFTGEKYDPVVYVFIDFDDWTEGGDAETLLTMSEKGKISDETLWEEMTRRGVLSTNFTAVRERERLLRQVPGDAEIVNG